MEYVIINHHVYDDNNFCMGMSQAESCASYPPAQPPLTLMYIYVYDELLTKLLVKHIAK